MRIEVEVYPLYWIEMDPRDLYDEFQVSLADGLASGKVDPAELDGTYWWTFDLTQPRKEIRVIREPQQTPDMDNEALLIVERPDQ